jgi:hypothetical protein
VNSIPVTVEITGPITQTLTQTYSSSVDRDEVKTLTFSTAIDMSMGGTFHFHCYTGNPHDVFPERNYFDKTITVGLTPAPPAITGGTHCGPGVVSLSASSPETIKWYTSASGGSSIATGTNYTTPYLTSSITYYVQAGTTCQSTRVPVTASITTGLAAPVGTDGFHCGDGTVDLSATSAYTVKWYDTQTSLVSLGSGSTFTTPLLSSGSTYYIAAENATCTSERVAVHATIHPVPAVPNTVDGERCGNGSVSLSATASDPVDWYASASGGSALGTGSAFSTPSISATTDFYAEANDGTCISVRVPVTATVNPIPAVSLGPDTTYSSGSSLVLDPGPGYQSYLWSTSDVSQSITASATGDYCVTVTDLNNCTNTACTYVEFTVGINTVNPKNIVFYPNPASHFVQVKTPFSSEHPVLDIYDSTGKLVFSRCLNREMETIDLGHLSNGLYLSRIISGNISCVERLILE